MKPETNEKNKKRNPAKIKRLSFMAIQEKLGLFKQRKPRVDAKPIASAAKEKKPLSYL